MFTYIVGNTLKLCGTVYHDIKINERTEWTMGTFLSPQTVYILYSVAAIFPFLLFYGMWNFIHTHEFTEALYSTNINKHVILEPAYEPIRSCIYQVTNQMTTSSLGDLHSQWPAGHMTGHMAWPAGHMTHQPHDHMTVVKNWNKIPQPKSCWRYHLAWQWSIRKLNSELRE